MQNKDFHALIIDVLNNRPAQWPGTAAQSTTQRFIDYAQQHGVIALLAQHQQSLEISGWPTAIIKAIAIANTTAKKVFFDRRQKVSEIFERFKAQKIDALIFKGAANAYLLYPEPHQRLHADIDIIIAQDQFKPLKELLNTMGFEFNNIEPTKFGPFQSTAILKEPEKVSVTLDIHWKINNRLALANTLEFDELSDRAITLQDYGPTIKAFCYADAVLAACIHEAGCLDYERGKLLGLHDVHLLLKKLDTPQLEALTARAIEKKIGALYLNYLQRCISTFEDAGQRQRIEKIESKFTFSDNEFSAKLLNSQTNWISNQWLDLAAVKGMPAKLELLISKLSKKILSQ